jgi:hypothetical protein
MNNLQTQQIAGGRRAGEGPAQSSEEVFEIISKAAYLTCYSGFDVLQPSNEFPLLPFIPELGYKRELFQVGRRIQMTTKPPTAEGGFQIRNMVAREAITLNYLILKIVPNYFEPNFETDRGLNPAPTVLLPFLQLKSMLIDEKFDLLDGRGSKLHLDGVSRTYPATGGIFIAGVGDITESYGEVAGAVGHIGVSGYSKLPPNFSLILVFRLADPTGRLISKSPLPPIDPSHRLKDLYPFSVLLTLMAELHPDYPVVIRPAPDGKKKQVHLVERVRLCDLSTDVRPNLIESFNAIGEVVGERRTTMVFDPDDSNRVIPLFTKDSEFRFFAEGNKTIGTLKAELSEARLFPTTSPDLQGPYFRIGGYGNFGEGTGQFKQVEGVLTSTGAFSLNPAALSSLYILRINDRSHRFRPLWS